MKIIITSVEIRRNPIQPNPTCIIGGYNEFGSAKLNVSLKIAEKIKDKMRGDKAVSMEITFPE